MSIINPHLITTHSNIGVKIVVLFDSWPSTQHYTNYGESSLFFSERGEASTRLSWWPIIRECRLCYYLPNQSQPPCCTHADSRRWAWNFQIRCFFTMQRSPNLGTCPYVGATFRKVNNTQVYYNSLCDGGPTSGEHDSLLIPNSRATS